MTSTYYNSDGSVDYVSVCVWYYDYAGEVDYSLKYEYDNEGTLIKTTKYDADGNVVTE